MNTLERPNDLELKPDDRPSVDNQHSSLRLLRIRVGQSLFREGDHWGEMYLVKEGKIGLFIKSRLVEKVEASGILGEMSMIDKGPRSASAVAMTDAVLLPIDEPQFHSMIRQTPAFAVMVMRVMCKRLRQMDATR